MPCLVRAIVPVPFWMTPEKVVLELSLPTDKVALAPVFVTVPAPASELIVSLKPAKSSVAPLAMVTSVPVAPSAKAVAEPSFSVPASILVAPV